MRTFLRFIPALLLAFTLSAVADPEVIWPVPRPPTGTPLATWPTPEFPNWFAHFERNLHEAQSHPVDLLFDGDSITDFWQSNGKKVWQERYVPLNAIDFGIGGDRVENVLWRIDQGELDGLHPKLIVLLIGANNQHDSVEQVADGISHLVASYRQHCPDAHLLLLGILPRNASPTDPARARKAQINQIISKLDDGKNITFLDIGAKFLQPDGTLTTDIMSDLLHPTEKGYRIEADAIQPIIDKYCPKSAATPATASLPAITRTPLTVTYPFPQRPADVPAPLFPRPQVRWFDAFQASLDRLKSGPYDLVLDGDESTAFWGGPGGTGAWHEHYGSIKTLNLGSVSDQVQNLLWRVQHGDLAGQDPKLIVLMIGAWSIYYGQKPADVAAGIKLVLNEYETRCPDAHILLLGIFPRGHDAKSKLRDGIAQVNQIISTYDDGKRVTYLDIGSKFLQPDGTISADVMPDFVHPSAKGYQIWADAIQPVVDRYFPKTVAK